MSTSSTSDPLRPTRAHPAPHPGQGLRVLLTEGSGLTSRQVAGRLGALGHHVGVLSSDSLGLTRFTRSTRAWHAIQPFGPDPLGWLDAALDVAAAHHYDVVFPTHEQVAVLAACPRRLAGAGLATAVPTFEALAGVLDKVSARSTLLRLGLPQPESVVVTDPSGAAAWDRFPVFAKSPIGTATTGIARIDDRRGLDELLAGPFGTAALEDGGIVLQAAANGPLAMLQGVFAHGALLASHANLRTREGVRGGASHKRSVDLPAACAELERLGAALRWHGGLSADVILTETGPLMIDVNPRLVEPGNAWQSGTDLVAAFLDVALGCAVEPLPPGRPDVATHQLLLALLGAASGPRGRRGVLGELAASARHRGDYRDSREELTPTVHDRRAALPVVLAAAATLVRPAAWEWFASGSVANYALAPNGWREIRRHAG